MWSFTAAVRPAVYTHHGPFISRSTFDRLLGLAPSPANALEFCAGTLQEMAGADVYEVADRYSRERAIAYVHCRNVVGKVPNYREVFIDEGDMDALRLLRVLHRNGFDGVVIHDRAPQMACDSPWHAGVAHALGYLRAALTGIGPGKTKD